MTDHTPCPLGLKAPAIPIKLKAKSNTSNALDNTMKGGKLTDVARHYSVPREGSLDHKELPSIVNGRRVYRKDSRQYKEENNVD